MSKMNRPGIDVVRFDESDIIVASGANTINVRGLGDNTAGNAFVNYKGTDYSPASDAQMSAFYSAFSAANRTNISGSTRIYIYPGDEDRSAPLSELNTWDAYFDNEYLNDTYVWNGEAFKHQ